MSLYIPGTDQFTDQRKTNLPRAALLPKLGPTQRLTTALANSLTTTIASTFNDGFLEIYSGAVPATPETASGTLLCSIILPAVAFGSPTDGVITMSGQWFGVNAASGTAAWGRLCNRAGTLFMVVTVGTSAKELILNTTTLVTGGVVSVTAFTYTVPMTA